MVSLCLRKQKSNDACFASIMFSEDLFLICIFQNLVLLSNSMWKKEKQIQLPSLDIERSFFERGGREHVKNCYGDLCFGVLTIIYHPPLCDL